MITIANAARYSIGKEIAHEVEYSDGTRVRAVEQPGSIIRCEHWTGSAWCQTGKPYVVKRSKVRNGERIKAAVEKHLEAK